jgi:hypothetical protein
VIFISVHGYNGAYGDIYKSIDGGDTFIRTLEGENKQGEKYCFNTIAIDPSDPNHIFAGGGNFYAPRGKSSLAIEYIENAFNEAEKSQDIELIAPIGSELTNAYAFAGQFSKLTDVSNKRC